jgi:CBS domain containing-hemolysin-like protein
MTSQRWEEKASARSPAGRARVRHSLPSSVRVSAVAITCLLGGGTAHASLFSGDTLDAVADVLAWIVLFLAPIIAIVVFWLVHIMPEKIAEKRRHPQAAAIKTLCLLSLFFGGLLWPLAWLWAYSKPVFHKLAYGTDVGEEHGPTPVVSESSAEVPSEAISAETVSEIEVIEPTGTDSPRIQSTRLHKTRAGTH